MLTTKYYWRQFAVAAYVRSRNYWKEVLYAHLFYRNLDSSHANAVKSGLNWFVVLSSTQERKDEEFANSIKNCINYRKDCGHTADWEPHLGSFAIIPQYRWCATFGNCEIHSTTLNCGCLARRRRPDPAYADSMNECIANLGHKTVICFDSRDDLVWKAGSSTVSTVVENHGMELKILVVP